MAYDLTILDSEEEYRNRFQEMYCDPYKPIFTCDEIWVRFYPEMFDHAFYESRSRIKGDKSIFSSNRAQKICWIKDALEDPDAVLKIGWDKNNNGYDNSRRVVIVKSNYVVIITLYEKGKARFVTAYTADEDTISLILSGPDWK